MPYRFQPDLFDDLWQSPWRFERDGVTDKMRWAADRIVQGYRDRGTIYYQLTNNTNTTGSRFTFSVQS